MATYKKRGYKPKAVKESVDVDNEFEAEAEEMDSRTAEVFNSLDETANKTEEWVAANQKYIFIVVGALALFALLFVAYERFVKEPKEAEAANEIYQAQQFFAQAEQASSTQKDSLYTMALTGGEGKLGLVDVANKFSGTNTGNVANYYAGFAYLKTGKYKEAIASLEDFSTKEPVLKALSYGGIGDAFAQLTNLEEALNYYQKAAAVDNSFTAPKFLLKSAKIAIELGKANEAVKALEQIKSEYVDSAEYAQVDGLLGKANAML